MKFINYINNTLKDNRNFRISLLFVCIVLIGFREPALLLHPRLWAEEGCVFYQFALHHSVYKIFTTAHVGYLTLFNSLVSAMQAKVFSVENAAVVSTYIGFFIQLIPIYIILFSKNKFWDNPLKKMLCVLMITIVMAPELMLNTTNSHFIFGLITFLIMIVSTNKISKIKKYFFRTLLFIGALTGPASMLIAPVFLLKAYHQKSKEKYIQALIIIICAISQLTVILYAIFYNNTYNRLSTHNYKHTLYAFFVDNFSTLPHTSTSYLHIILFFLGICFGVFMAVLYVFIFIKNRPDTNYLIALISILIVGTFSTLGSLNMEGSPRYGYIPTCIFIILLINESFKLNRYKIKYITSFALLICLLTNTAYYRYGMRNVYKADYPKWVDEVAKWRIDSTYSPRVHPGSDAGQCVKL